MLSIVCKRGLHMVANATRLRCMYRNVRRRNRLFISGQVWFIGRQGRTRYNVNGISRQPQIFNFSFRRWRDTQLFLTSWLYRPFVLCAALSRPLTRSFSTLPSDFIFLLFASLYYVVSWFLPSTCFQFKWKRRRKIDKEEHTWYFNVVRFYGDEIFELCLKVIGVSAQVLNWAKRDKR